MNESWLQILGSYLFSITYAAMNFLGELQGLFVHFSIAYAVMNLGSFFLVISHRSPEGR